MAASKLVISFPDNSLVRESNVAEQKNTKYKATGTANEKCLKVHDMSTGTFSTKELNSPTPALDNNLNCNSDD